VLHESNGAVKPNKLCRMSYSHSAKIGTSMILVAAAIAVGAVAQLITVEKKSPGHTPDS